MNSRAHSTPFAGFGHAVNPAGNITQYQTPNGTSAASYNNVNALTAFTWDAAGELGSFGPMQLIPGTPSVGWPESVTSGRTSRSPSAMTGTVRQPLRSR